MWPVGQGLRVSHPGVVGRRSAGELARRVGLAQQ